MELLDWMATWPYPARVGIMLLGWGVGIRAGVWLTDKVFDYFAATKERRAAQMRDVTPR